MFYIDTNISYWFLHIMRQFSLMNKFSRFRFMALKLTRKDYGVYDKIKLRAQKLSYKQQHVPLVRKIPCLSKIQLSVQLYTCPTTAQHSHNVGLIVLEMIIYYKTKPLDCLLEILHKVILISFNAHSNIFFSNIHF